MNSREILQSAGEQVVRPGRACSAPMLQIAMCTMHRVEYLPWTIACLEAQTESRIRLAIWNNNRSERDRLESLLARASPSFPVSLVHSDSNVGGVGRFFLARRGSLDFDCPVVFIDDDQFLAQTCLERLLASWCEQTLVGWWAWRFLQGGGYRDRIRASSGEGAHYLGTGGLILPRDVLSDSRLIDDLPETYSRVEDLWLSYFATTVLGHTLVASEDLITPISDGRNQHHQLKQEKQDFLALLRAQYDWSV